MEIVTCYQTKNRCYQKGTAANHIGILVHSTGAVNKNLKRYVDYEDRLGKNTYNNHWNSSKADKCMHSFIGLDKNAKCIVAETLPYEYACWGCGKGKNGSYNRNPTAHIQFEICQGSDTDSAYYWVAIGIAEEYCAYLCRKFGFSAANIVSHREAAIAGYASNHGDPDSWMKKFGDSMDKFRSRVQAHLSGEDPGVDNPTEATPVCPTLAKGDKGADVEKLQQMLIERGYTLPKYGADGSFGNETLFAVRRFQEAAGLTTDGIVGHNTWNALYDTSQQYYTVTIPGVTYAMATEIKDRYTQAVITEDKG